MKSILVIGGSGFVGQYFALQTQQYNIHLTYGSNNILCTEFEKIVKLDITNFNEVNEKVNEIQPSIIIHLAAITNLEYCEQNKFKTWEVNVLGLKNVIQAANKINARLVFLSTDLVFSGNKGMYNEEDKANPICYYGMTKLEGENIVKDSCENYCILRSSLIFGMDRRTHKQNFSETLIAHLLINKEIRLFKDEYRTPIYIKNLCSIILEIAISDKLQGIYHVSGNERVSRFEFGLIASSLIKNSRHLIFPTLVKSFQHTYLRPQDCSLSNMKLKKVMKIDGMTIRDGIFDLLDSLQKITEQSLPENAS